ncbi:MAG: UPF0164 family protein [Spirochaetia bacterium]
MRKFLLVFILILLTSLSVWGDFAEFYNSIAPPEAALDPNTGLTVFPILLIPSGGRYEGMGTAFTAVADDSGFIEANPSGSSLLTYTELSFTHNNWIADSNMEGVVFSVRFGELGIGFGGKFLYVPFTEYDQWGERSSKGYYTESVATMNISYNFFSSYYFYGVAVGTNIKVAFRTMPSGIYATNPIGSQTALMGMADVGILTRFNFLKFYHSRGRNLSIGAVVMNLGPYALGEPLPTEATFGLSYSPIRPLLFAFDFNLPFSFDTVNYPAERWGISAGMDLAFTSFFSIQTGFKYRGSNPKISVGSMVDLAKVSFTVNYTMDLTTSSNSVDHFSIQARLKLGDRGRADLRNTVDDLYTSGLEAYANGRLTEAINFWNKVLELDPSFQPANEMKLTARRALNLREAMESIQQVE